MSHYASSGSRACHVTFHTVFLHSIVRSTLSLSLCTLANTDRYLELDSTAGDKGPLSNKAMHSSWVKASLCGLAKTSYVEA